jgi:ketosteroid isomerase-like protein
MIKFCIMLLLLVGTNAQGTNQIDSNKLAIGAVLDQFHHAASIANTQQYFELLTEDAIFLGTDAKERWTKAEFKTYVTPWFAQGKGWLYQVQQRHINLNPTTDVAYFDELLFNQKYGLCRGSGVLFRTKLGWRIAQYNLSVPLPNAIADSLVEQIRAYHAPQQ